MKFAIYIDTSILGTGFAIRAVGEKKNGILSKFCNFEKNESSIKLSEFVNQSLEAEQLCLADLIALVVSVGPGSYTGVRVGLAWSLGLLLPQREQVKSLGVSSLKLASKSLQLSSSKKTYLFLANTQSNGFVACSSVCGTDQVSFVDMTDCRVFTSLALDRSADIYMDDSWKIMKDAFDQEKINYICVKRSWIAKKAFQAMLTYVDKKEMLLSRKTSLHPLYMKEWSLTKR